MHLLKADDVLKNVVGQGETMKVKRQMSLSPR